MQIDRRQQTVELLLVLVPAELRTAWLLGAAALETECTAWFNTD